jgi:hypothetical protein
MLTHRIGVAKFVSHQILIVSFLLTAGLAVAQTPDGSPNKQSAATRLTEPGPGRR